MAKKDFDEVVKYIQIAINDTGLKCKDLGSVSDRSEAIGKWIRLELEAAYDLGVLEEKRLHISALAYGSSK